MSNTLKRKRITLEQFAALVRKEFDGATQFTYAQSGIISDKYGVSVPTKAINMSRKIKPGLFDLSDITEIAPTVEATPIETVVVPETTAPVMTPSGVVATSLDASISFIPKIDRTYVPWGNATDITKILRSKMFFPIYLTGMSGNGKTFGIEQTSALLKREMIRVNFTAETDEDDLFGGFRLVAGETVFQYGPVVEAMKRGAILLLDEIDLASHKVMALQSVLEGKGYFIKKLGEWVEPTEGFTVIATANTKGKGSDDGRFIGTNIMNEAFLDRFSVTMYQPYPSEVIEKRILLKSASQYAFDKDDIEEFVSNLTMWGDIIRKTFEEGGVDEIISTRRLVDILKSYSIFGDRMKSIKMAIERFDDETRESFMSLYEKIDAKVDMTAEEETEAEEGGYPPR
jgi:hypothetical protein